MTKREICLIYNPKAKGGKTRKLQAFINTLNASIELLPTQRPGHAEVLARDAVNSGIKKIIAAGGDGTINEVVNGLLSSTKQELDQIVLGVLPSGTANVFAKELGLPTDIKDAWSIICIGKTKSIDIPRVEYLDSDSPTYRYFIQLAGAGVDAKAVQDLNLSLKEKLGKFAYLVSLARAVSSSKPKLQVKLESAQLQAEQVLIGNGRYYAGSFKVFPLAKNDDGLLDIIILRKANWFGFVFGLIGLASHKLYKMPGITMLRTHQAHIESASKVPVELDGELAGTLPIKLIARSQRLKVIIP
jgi:YegS/Rv2252/BmrU family lipid kinase